MKKLSLKKDPFLAREAQKYPNPIPSREYIMQYLESYGKPVRRSFLIEAFDLHNEVAQEALRRRLNAMLRDGQIITNRKGCYALVKQMALVRGHVECQREGYGFLIPDDGGRDIYLNARQMRNLFPGDRILVSVTSQQNRGRREGVVVEILKRNFTQIAGRFIQEKGISYVIPENKGINHEIIIPQDKTAKAKSGQIVVADILTYPQDRVAATGAIVEILGEHLAPGMEVELAIRAHALPFRWSQGVLAECRQFSQTMIAKEKQTRKQLQHLPFVTIDGEDAKDFDDAVYCEQQPRQGWKLYVAIADVSHYVRFGTALDQEAANRGNSVYFPGQVIPMLPEVLANELCSLQPDIDRLCMVCEMQMSKAGKITSYEFYDAVIKSHARLTYDSVYRWLENENKATSKHLDLLPHLQELKKLYLALLKQRQERGALDFNRVETKIVFGKNRKIAKIVPVQNHYVHGIIEECMLSANVCASKFLLAGKISALYRVHAGPDKEKLANLRDFLQGLGLKIGGYDKPQPKDYAQLLQKIAGRPDEYLVQTVLLRSLSQAIYTSENTGHFALAYKGYSHFTSPIRRYPDLLNHRAIRYLLHGGKTKKYGYTADAMQSIGEHCSMTERRADLAVRDVQDWLKCEFMQNKLGKKYAGIISGITNFGVFVTLKEVFVEGLIHITSLKADYYNFDPVRHRLVGKRSGVVYRLGDSIDIVVARVDLAERKIDFALK